MAWYRRVSSLTEAVTCSSDSLFLGGMYKFSYFLHRKHHVVADYKILCLGLIQSLFEGSMYTFVLEWTPALTPAELDPAKVEAAASSTERATIPHGYIFAAFMVGI